jgi:crossover junction endodeoxyribonuclease RuvC
MSIPMPNNTILAIDPGFDRVGVAILTGSRERPLLTHSECITTNPKSDHDKRLLTIGARIEEVIGEYNPGTLAIETLFFNKNISSAIGVAEARGVILFQAAQAGLEVAEYSPQAIKLAVTGFGQANKQQMEVMVRKLISLPDKRRLDDELDAVAVGITHLATRKLL